MKKIFLILFVTILSLPLYSQLISDKNQKISVNLNVFTDFPTASDEGIDYRTINQGFSAAVSYNFKLGQSKHAFSLGAGIRSQNLYSNCRIADVHADTIQFVPIETSYKRSKINFTYIDIPAELKFRFNNKIKLGVGFQFGFLISSKEKYVGNVVDGGERVYEKRRNISSLEKYAYGPTLRIGWNWITAFAYYQINDTFQVGLGPKINPISVGITLSPF